MSGPVERIEIDYKPRKWARAFHASYKRWMALVLHRRAGKTTGVIHHHQRAATNDAWERRRLLATWADARAEGLDLPDLTDAHLTTLLRGRRYAHILPTLKQAKLTAWDMLKYAASFVPGAKTNESELRIDYPNGSRVQLFGADNIDALRGIHLSGLSLDEYGQHPPGIFSEVLSKALADHLGYCIWAGTIRGKNQLYQAYEAGRKNPETWFTLWQDIDVSLETEDDVSALMLRQALHDDRKLVEQGLMTQEEFDQEWYLSTEAAIKGAYYGKQIAEARRSGRIGVVPYDPMLPVDTDWDLGVADYTTIWFSQSTRSGEVRLIDYYENHDLGLDHYIRHVKDKPYVYGQHWAPHDIEVRELSTGKSRKDIAAALGIKFQIGPKLSLADGIAAARLLIPRCWFNQATCEAGIEALTHYRKGWNERLQQFTSEPMHDWSSHGADAYRYLAVRHKTPKLAAAVPDDADRLSRRFPTGTGWMAG